MIVPSAQPTRVPDSEFERLESRALAYRPMNPHIRTALYVCVAVGSISSIIRYRAGWTYEESPLWLNCGFWGGYFLADLVFGPLVAFGFYRDRRYIEDVRMLMKQKELRQGVDGNCFGDRFIT